MPQRKRLTKRRIMREFTIAELSAVDRPAQQHATMAIMKRDDDEPDALVSSIVKRYIDPSEGAKSFSEILNAQEKEDEFYTALQEFQPVIYALESSLRSIAGDRDLTKEAKQRLMESSVQDFLTMAKERLPQVEEALAKLVAELDDVSKGEGNMPDTTEKRLEELEKKLEELTAKNAELVAASEDAAKVDEVAKERDAIAKEKEELAAELEATKSDLDAAKARSDLSAEEREFADSLEKSEQTKFLALSAEDRATLMAKKADADETIEIAGRTVRKSVVGEDQFAVMKAQQAELADTRADLAKERERRERAELTKRAEGEFEHLPGSTEDKVGVLKAIQALPEGEREAAEKMLKAGEAAVKSAFDTIGVSGGDGNALKKSGADFEKRVAEVKKRDDCSNQEAMARARKEYPEEFEAYQSSAH